MTITYKDGSSQNGAASNPESSSHLTLIAGAISIVFIIVVIGLWFGFSQSRDAVESVATDAAAIIPTVSSQPPVRVYEATDGLTQCHTRVPDLATRADRDKRTQCYFAVMTIFGTIAICDLTPLDAASSGLCQDAQELFRAEYPNGIPQDPDSATIPPGGTGTPGTNTSSGTSGSPSGAGTVSGGSTRPPGSGQSGGQGSGNSNANSTTSANTNTNTNSSTVNTNTNSTNSGNTNSPDTVSSANTNTSGNQNTNTTPDPTICVIDPSDVSLLQHTNDCQ